ALERLGAPRAERDMAEAGPPGLGQLEAVAQVVAPAAQVDGLPLARLLLEAEHVDEEPAALLPSRRPQLGGPRPRPTAPRPAPPRPPSSPSSGRLALLAAARRGSTPSESSSSQAASISSTRRAACRRLPSTRRWRSDGVITSPSCASSHSRRPAASAAARLSS